MFLYNVFAYAGNPSGVLPGSSGEDAPNVSAIPKVKFWAALSKGDLTTLENMLAGGYSADDQNYEGMYAVHRAIHSDSPSSLALLVKYGADLERKDKNGFTPLILASSLGRRGMVERLIANKVSINVRDRYGATALVHSVQNEHSSIARLLVAAGADKRIADYSGRDASVYARSSRRPSLRRLLE